MAPHESGLARRSGLAPSARRLGTVRLLLSSAQRLAYCPQAVLGPGPLAGSDSLLVTPQVVTADNRLAILLMVTIPPAGRGPGPVRRHLAAQHGGYSEAPAACNVPSFPPPFFPLSLPSLSPSFSSPSPLSSFIGSLGLSNFEY